MYGVGNFLRSESQRILCGDNYLPRLTGSARFDGLEELVERRSAISVC